MFTIKMKDGCKLHLAQNCAISLLRYSVLYNFAEQILSKMLNKVVNAQKLLRFMHKKMRKKSQKNICAKIAQILRNKYGNFVETLDVHKSPLKPSCIHTNKQTPQTD